MYGSTPRPRTYIGKTGSNHATDSLLHSTSNRLGLCHMTDSTDYYQQLTLESWFTNLEQTPLNRSQQLPS